MTTFSIRTPSHIKSCHVTGSWDNYGQRYAMTPDAASGKGYWTLTVKFGSSMPEGRHWYYFILDGYFESHDPNTPNCVEPARNITLNILDYTNTPTRSSSASSGYSYDSATSSPASSKRSGGYYARRERAPSPRRINSELPHLVHPKPRNPLKNHKLTLDTAQPVSRGSSVSPVSARSYSSSSGGSGPATPIYDSDDYDEFSDECDSEDEEYPRVSRHAPVQKSKYAPADELTYRLERGLRI